MKDEAHHMKHLQKKVIQEHRREQNRLKEKERVSDQKEKRHKEI